MIFSKVMSVVIGYFCGCFLTAEVITRKMTGKPCRELGTTGNPGMANVMAHLGFKPGILVLIGDLAKTVIAVVISMLIFHRTGHIIVFYAALGATLGHNYPFWQKFHGGKGVATSCAGYFLMNPLTGLIAMIAGMLVVFVTQYLGLGAAVISVCYIPLAFLCDGTEAGILSIIMAGLMLIKHGPAIHDIFTGKVEKVDVWGNLTRRLKRH